MVHDLVKQLAEHGIGILFISDEIPEVLSNCHRVLVMQKGKIVRQVFPGPDGRSASCSKASTYLS